MRGTGDNKSDVYDCLILGAGIAGLTAARSLAEAGRRVLVLEARDRIGGRLLTEHPEGESTPVELGAEFVHGRPAELLALLEEAGLAFYETSGKEYRYAGGTVRPAGEEDGAAFGLLEELDPGPDQGQDQGRESDSSAGHARGHSRPHAGEPAEARSGDELQVRAEDQTFDEFLAARKPPEADARRARQYVEGFNAADASRIGTRGLARQQAAEDANEGDRSARLESGYSALAGYQGDRVEAAGARLLLHAPVTVIEWSRGQVLVTASAERFRASAVIVALPLGVLQEGTVRFLPELPQVSAALGLLASGPVQRLVLRFRIAFWAEQAPGMRFLFTDDQMPPTWWTTSPRASTLLTGWAGGPRALVVDGPEELVSGALASLERIFALDAGTLQSQLLGWYAHDWQQDPWSRGAYSYALKGGADAPDALAVPFEDTLFFAGEHTDTSGHPGTVHGALRSGLRAAAQVLASLAGQVPAANRRT